MLRLDFLRQPCGHNFPTTDEAHSQVEWVKCIVDDDFNEDVFPDRSMILAFHCPLSRHGEALANLTTMNDYLADHGLLQRKGTVVDATIIAAPSSTKNRDAARDPKTLRVRTGNRRDFPSTLERGSLMRMGSHTEVVV
jgi:IS5 family transposase